MDIKTWLTGKMHKKCTEGKLNQSGQLHISIKSTVLSTHFVMFVKDTLEEEVRVVVKLCGAVWGDLYPAIQGKAETINKN